MSIHPTKNCVLLFRKKGVGSLVWIDLLRLEVWHVSALFCAASGVIWQRNHVFRPPANIFALQLRALSPLPPGRGGRRDHCLNTSPVKQDLVFDTRLQGDRQKEKE